MSGTRLSSGGLIDRARRIDFNFDGRSMHGFGGDTLASALLANGTGIVGRSFKYHRPRGVWGGWFDEPNAIFSVRTPKGSLPNVLGTTTALAPGMDIRSVNAWPNAGFDVKGGLDLFSPWLKAGFYYKTFMKPDWHLFERPKRRRGKARPSGWSKIMTRLAAGCTAWATGSKGFSQRIGSPPARGNRASPEPASSLIRPRSGCSTIAFTGLPDNPPWMSPRRFIVCVQRSACWPAGRSIVR